VQDSLLVAHLQEALKSKRKDKERAWEQNDFLKDELARSRQDIEALRGKAQELAALLGAAQALSGGAVTPSNAAVVAAEAKEAAASTTMEIVVGGDDLLL
jgi:hydroxyethylthiazole kinase-like sugar kinase family protein